MSNETISAVLSPSINYIPTRNECPELYDLSEKTGVPVEASAYMFAHAALDARDQEWLGLDRMDLTTQEEIELWAEELEMDVEEMTVKLINEALDVYFNRTAA